MGRPQAVWPAGEPSRWSPCRALLGRPRGVRPDAALQGRRRPLRTMTPPGIALVSHRPEQHRRAAASTETGSDSLGMCRSPVVAGHAGGAQSSRCRHQRHVASAPGRVASGRRCVL